MTNEKDSNVIHNLFAEFHYADDLGVIKSKLSEYVASVRNEEREAAFRNAVQILSGLPVNNNVQNFTRASAFKAQALALLRTAGKETE